MPESAEIRSGLIRAGLASLRTTAGSMLIGLWFVVGAGHARPGTVQSTRDAL